MKLLAVIILYLILSISCQANERLDADSLYLLLSSSDKKTEEKIFIGESILKIYTKLQVIEKQQSVHFYLGAYYQKTGAYAKSLMHLQKSKTIAKNIEDQASLSRTVYYLGKLYLDLEDYTKAKEEFAQATKIFHDLKDSIGLAAVSNSLGIAYQKTGASDSAFLLFTQSRNLYLELGDSLMANYPRSNIAFQKVEQSKYADALIVFKNVANQKGIQSNPGAYARALANLGYCYTKMGILDSAETYMLASLTKAEKGSFIKDLYQAYSDLSEIKALQGDTVSAYQWHKKFVTLKDSITGDGVQQELSDLHIKFIELSTRNKLLQKEQEKKEILFQQELKNNRYQFLVVIAVALLMIASLLFFNQRRKMKEKSARFELKKKIAEVELKSQRLEKVRLKEELDNKIEDLTNFGLDLARRSEFESELYQRLKEMYKSLSPEYAEPFKQILILAKGHDKINNDLDKFQKNVETVNQSFYEKLLTQYPNLTHNERLLCGLFRLNLSTKDVALIKGISSRSVEMSRYRLRKKLNLDQKKNLVLFLNSLSI